MMRDTIKWPKLQYLHAIPSSDTTTTAASVVTTAKDLEIEVNIWGNVDGKVELKQNV